MTREQIEQLSELEPYCFETDREEQWYRVGLQEGLSIADANPKSPWISVDDDLPCNHEELITTDGYYEKETVVVITISKSGIIDTNYMVLYNNDIWRWKYGVVPCYRMPIPELPKNRRFKYERKKYRRNLRD